MIAVLVLVLAASAAASQPYTTDPAMLAPPMYDGDIPLIEPRGMSLHDPLERGNAVVPVITRVRHDSMSYDLTFTFTNSLGTPRPLGRISVGTLALGRNITVYDHQQESRFADMNHDTALGYRWTYPGTAYSPVMVLMNQTHIVGVSLQYPVMDYKHGTLVRLGRLGGVFKGPPEAYGWMVAFDLNNAPATNQHTEIRHEALLQPGESKSYTISVRAIKRPSIMPDAMARQDWLSVLEPYKEYFSGLYGSVQYERRTKPIFGAEIANGHAIGPSNLRGFYGNELRPDRVGFAPIASRYANQDYGYDNVLFWAPSGLFDQYRGLNYPSLFTAGWLDSTKLRSATDSNAFPIIPQRGKELGFWWGRSARYMDRWNDNESEPLDPDNPRHMQQVHLQMDLATDAGATMIGLDAFTHQNMPVWKQKPYIEHLRNRYPGVTYTTEQLSSDVMHVVMPSSNRGYGVSDRSTGEMRYHRLERPLYLADYIVPGHETWAFWRYAEILDDDPAQVIDSERVQRDLERLARLGYLPVTHGVAIKILDADALAPDETWRFTSPSSDGDSGDDSTVDEPGDGNGGGDDKGNSGDRGGGDDSGDDSDEFEPPSRPERVYYITLPNGRRLKIVSR
ncbi:MAG: hypothetical protein ED559_02535 [Phycisphaera sp.]|nr:MAG: hypothetical protein ED559_02535 [Phycisphaera sp.]